MPTYTYLCNKCQQKFELFSNFVDYVEHPKCLHCKSVSTARSYEDDLKDVSCSVKKHTSELKTLGDIANRNRDSMSDDQKIALHQKHNAYKEDSSETPMTLPKGVSKMKKPQTKTKWT